MVEIEQRVIISCAGGSQVQVLEKLLVSHAGQKYLKLLGSHHGICRLVSGQTLETYKKASNPSLAGSPALKQLKSQVQDSIRNNEEVSLLVLKMMAMGTMKIHKKESQSCTSTKCGHRCGWPESDLLDTIRQDFRALCLAGQGHAGCCFQCHPQRH